MPRGKGAGHPNSFFGKLCLAYTMGRHDVLAASALSLGASRESWTAETSCYSQGLPQSKKASTS